MFGLPQSTVLNMRLLKQSFYEKLGITAPMKKVWTDDIQVIYWRHKIAATTTALAKGTEVEEIEVFEIQLKKPELPKAVLQRIDKAIPYHILFVLSYAGKYQAWIGYEQRVYYHTVWVEADAFSIHLDGLNMDAVYQNLVRQIAGEILERNDAEESLQESVARQQQREKIQKQIAILKAKIRREKQPRKKFELVSQLHKFVEILNGL